MTLLKNSSLARLGASIVVGIVVGVVVGLVAQNLLAVLVGWIATLVTFMAWTWFVIWPTDGDETRTHSQREDPSRAASEGLSFVAAVASIAGVGVLLAQTGNDEPRQKIVGASVAILAVAGSWALIHTLYALRYARLFYDDEEAKIVDFNEEDGYEPSYQDFAYLAWDMGTTYQVSDTSVRTTRMRRTVMGHGLLGYAFGTVILASAINLVVSLVG